MEIKTSNINKPSNWGILLTRILGGEAEFRFREGGSPICVEGIRLGQAARSGLRRIGLPPSIGAELVSVDRLRSLLQNHKPKSAKTSKSVPYKKTLCHSLNPSTAPALHKKTLVWKGMLKRSNKNSDFSKFFIESKNFNLFIIVKLITLPTGRQG